MDHSDQKVRNHDEIMDFKIVKLTHFLHQYLLINYFTKIFDYWREFRKVLSSKF